MKKISLIFMALILMVGCADTSPEMIQCMPGNPYGFFGGLWHGLIAPLSLIGSIFSDDIAFYAINNSGGWYDFGFALGIGALTTSASSSK
jgi:hypothetical protein